MLTEHTEGIKIVVRLLPGRERRPNATRDRGYSLPELLTALGIASVIGLAVASALAVALGTLNKSQVAATNMARAVGVINEFEEHARAANRVLNATTRNFDYVIQRGGHDTQGITCDRHSLNIEADPSAPGTYRLRHSVWSVDPPGLSGCLEAYKALQNAAVAALPDRIEITKLGSTSKFQYYNSGGQRLLVSGDTGYSVETAPCKIGQVQIVLDMNPVGSTAYARQESSRVAIRSNAAGYTCAQVWVTIATATPASGSITGGQTVVLTGSNLINVTSVTFGGTPAASFTVNSSTQITAVTPAHTAGLVDIGVTTSVGKGVGQSLYQYS